MGARTLSKLIIRADASVQIGSGHILRCLALAQAWQDGSGPVLFVTHGSLPPSLSTRLQVEAVNLLSLDCQPGSIEDAQRTAALAREFGAIQMVVDGYHFGADYQRAIKEAGLKLLFIDDTGHAEHYYADWVLNQNIYADPGLYASRETYTRLLLGTQFVLLRREFWKWRRWRHEIPDMANKLLVTAGGTDPDNITLQIIEGLNTADLRELAVVVVVGGANPHVVQLQHAIELSSHKIRLDSNVSDMPTLMAWADIALSAAGSTIWELLFMGVPSITFSLAENQRHTADKLLQENVTMAVDATQPSDIATVIHKLLADKKTRAMMAKAGTGLVDGDGVERVLMRLQNLKVRLRPASEDDCEILWQWANDPGVRSASFSVAPIPWETHVEWFKGKLADVRCHIFIALDENDQPIGQIRFDAVNEREAQVGISIDKRHRGVGLGQRLIQLGVEKVSRTTPLRVIDALIKIGNTASIKAFEGAGFTRLGVENILGNQAAHYRWVKESRGD